MSSDLYPSNEYYYNLVYGYAATNRLEEASAMIREAPAKQLDSVFLNFYLAFLNNDAATTEKQVG